MSQDATADLEADLEAETARIIRSGTLWTAAGVIAPAAALGPLLAAGWRPSALPGALRAAWWTGAVAGAGGLALLVWAGCPVPAFTPERAHRQKADSIRAGIAMNLAGMGVSLAATLLSPAR